MPLLHLLVQATALLCPLQVAQLNTGKLRLHAAQLRLTTACLRRPMALQEPVKLYLCRLLLAEKTQVAQPLSLTSLLRLPVHREERGNMSLVPQRWRRALKVECLCARGTMPRRTDI